MTGARGSSTRERAAEAGQGGGRDVPESAPDRRKDGWDRAAIVGSLLLPLAVAALGAAVTWSATRAQADVARLGARSAQATALAPLLDALAAEECGPGKSIAIRLARHVLQDDAAANDLYAALVEGNDSICAELAVRAFQERISVTAPELAAAQATVLTSSDARERAAARGTIQASPYAALVLHEILTVSLADDEAGGDEQVLEVMRDPATVAVAGRAPLVADLGETILRSPDVTRRAVDAEIELRWAPLLRERDAVRDDER
jgi:hypothetical protein